MTAPHVQAPPRRVLKPFRWPVVWVGMWCSAVVAVVVLSLIRMPAVDLPHGSDKVEHLFAYALLAAGAVQLMASRVALCFTGIMLVLMGVSLEIAQARLTDYRTMDGWDALANTLGVLLGLATHCTPLRDVLLRVERWWR